MLPAGHGAGQRLGLLLLAVVAFAVVPVIPMAVPRISVAIAGRVSAAWRIGCTRRAGRTCRDDWATIGGTCLPWRIGPAALNLSAGEVDCQGQH